MSKRFFKIEELSALTPIRNEEARFLCGGTQNEASDLSKTQGDSTHSSSSDSDANTQDADGPAHNETQPQLNWV